MGEQWATTSPAEALGRLNDVMLRRSDDGRFVTIAYLLITVEGRRARVKIACAGHPEPILVPASDDPRPVGARGDLLGVWSDVRLAPVELELERGDSLVAYTDGVTDQSPGPERLPARALGERPAGADAERLAGIVEDLAANPAGQRDDIAILALSFTDEQQSSAGRQQSAATATQLGGEAARRDAPAQPPGQVAACAGTAAGGSRSMASASSS